MFKAKGFISENEFDRNNIEQDANHDPDALPKDLQVEHRQRAKVLNHRDRAQHLARASALRQQTRDLARQKRAKEARDKQIEAVIAKFKSKFEGGAALKDVPDTKKRKGFSDEACAHCKRTRRQWWLAKKKRKPKNPSDDRWDFATCDQCANLCYCSITECRDALRAHVASAHPAGAVHRRRSARLARDSNH